jgi:hypothetical protein
MVVPLAATPHNLPVSSPRVLRSSLDRIFYWSIGALLVGLPLLGFLLIGANGELGEMSFGAVAGLIAIVLVGLFVLRLALVRVVLHDDHIELVNPLRTFRYYWNDVEEIDIISAPGWIVRVWAGGVARWAWGTSRVGQFGLIPFTSAHDDPAKDAPHWVYQGYRDIHAAWKRGR